MTRWISMTVVARLRTDEAAALLRLANRVDATPEAGWTRHEWRSLRRAVRRLREASLSPAPMIGECRVKADRIAARSDLANFGIRMGPTDFGMLVAEHFEARYRCLGSAVELLLRPREAIRFADSIRDALAEAGEDHAFDLPDDAILRILRCRDRFASVTLRSAGSE